MATFQVFRDQSVVVHIWRLVTFKEHVKAWMEIWTKVIWEQRVTLTQLHNKIPTGYNGMPHFYLQNSPFPLDNHHPRLIHPSLDRPHSPPKCHLDPVNCFATFQNDRPTDTWDRREKGNQECLCSYCIDRQRHVTHTHTHTHVDL